MTTNATRSWLFTQKIVVIALVCAIATPGLLGFAPKAHAASGGEALAAGTAACIASAYVSYWLGTALGSSNVFKVGTNDGPLAFKAVMFDCIAWVINNVLIQQITDETVRWINSGFNGNPAYITDFDSFLEKASDNAAGAYLQNKNLGFLCSPFQLNLRLALQAKVLNDQAQQYTCSLSRVSNNIQGFFNGNFFDGGWQGWFELTQKPQNSPYEAYLMTSSDLDRAIASSLGTAAKKLSTGNFLSKEQCVEYGPAPEGGGPAECKRTEIVTPGSVVQERLNKALGMGNDRIVIAKQLNEVLSAAINQILLAVLTKEGDSTHYGGLRGYDYGQSIVAGPGETQQDQVPLPEPDGGGAVCVPNAPTLTSTGGTAGQNIIIDKSGVFHTASPNNPQYVIPLPLPKATNYKKITADVDVKIGDWFQQKTDGNHMIFDIQRSTEANFRWAENTVGFLSIKGPAAGETSGVTFRSGYSLNINNNCPALNNTRKAYQFQKGEIYHFSFSYDTTTSKITTVVRQGAGNSGPVIISMQNQPTANIIQSIHPPEPGASAASAGSGFLLIFGEKAWVAGDVPSYGWEYSNLHAEFTN